MRFYGLILLLMIVKCSDQSQNKLECYSCDDCDIMSHMNVKIETCEVEFEQLVVAETLEDSETVRPEVTTTDLLLDEQSDDLAMVKEVFPDENPLVMDMEMNVTADADEDVSESGMTTESYFTTIADETTTDFPGQRIRRSSEAMSFCYKLLTRSGE